MTSLCACMGPRYGEPFCHCRMESGKHERSPAHKEANSPENLQKTMEEFKLALAEMFDKNKERYNV